MNLDKLISDDEVLHKGDIISYQVQPLRHENDAGKRYGRILKFKHGQVYIRHAILVPIWDMPNLTFTIGQSMLGPFHNKIAHCRKREEVRKIGIEDLI